MSQEKNISRFEVENIIKEDYQHLLENPLVHVATMSMEIIGDVFEWYFDIILAPFFHPPGFFII